MSLSRSLKINNRVKKYKNLRGQYIFGLFLKESLGLNKARDMGHMYIIKRQYKIVWGADFLNSPP